MCKLLNNPGFFHMAFVYMRICCGCSMALLVGFIPLMVYLNDRANIVALAIAVFGILALLGFAMECVFSRLRANGGFNWGDYHYTIFRTGVNRKKTIEELLRMKGLRYVTDAYESFIGHMAFLEVHERAWERRGETKKPTGSETEDGSESEAEANVGTAATLASYYTEEPLSDDGGGGWEPYMVLPGIVQPSA
jgi:hypothetical protein